MNIKRRSFLKGFSSLACYSAAATTPVWINKSAHALSSLGTDDDRILVILQHGGGLDGLNTVIPRTDDVYYDDQIRPTIRVPKGSEINLDGLNGLHPRLTGLADWYQKGNMAVVQNVGYMNPNQSHFTSTDIFEYAQNPRVSLEKRGWVARYYDNACEGMEPGVFDLVAAGKNSIPDSINGSPMINPPTINRPSDYAFQFSDDETYRRRAMQLLNGMENVSSEIDFMQRSYNTTNVSTQDVRRADALETLVPENRYPNNDFGRGLKLVSKIIRAGFQTKVFYVSQTGYDTHANQAVDGNPNAGRHPQLLGEFDSAVDAFLQEMDQTGNLDRVVLMTFSEFGRRVKENSSSGTDHGAANCMFLFGGAVQGGVYGGQPDLENLERGNTRFKVDFRSVYAQLIENWLGSQAAPVLGDDVYQNIIQKEMDQVQFLPKADPVRVDHWSLY
jgi:uncharacterized protein (DUF1501 family)